MAPACLQPNCLCCTSLPSARQWQTSMPNNTVGQPHALEVQLSPTSTICHVGLGWWELGVQPPLKASALATPALALLISISILLSSASCFKSWPCFRTGPCLFWTTPPSQPTPHPPHLEATFPWKPGHFPETHFIFSHQALTEVTRLLFLWLHSWTGSFCISDS